MRAAVVVCGLLQRKQEGEQAFGRSVRLGRVPQGRPPVAIIVAISIEIGFIEGKTDPHIQEIANGAATIDAVCCLRQQACHGLVRINKTVGFQTGKQQRRQGLADGEYQMRLVHIRMRRIVFGNDLAAPHQHEGIGMGVGQKCARGPVSGKSGFHGLVEQRRLCQRRFRPFRLRAQQGARHDFAGMSEAPAAEGGGPPVGKRNVFALEAVGPSKICRHENCSLLAGHRKNRPASCIAGRAGDYF